MATEKYLEEANLIPADVRLHHVAFSLAGQLSVDLPGLAPWRTAAVGKEPDEIFDLNGKPLFYDYPVRKGQQVLGYVRAAASKVLGTVAVSYDIGPRGWDIAANARKAAALVKKQNPGAKIGEPKLVCYGYPKLGFLFEAARDGEAPVRIVLDGPTLQPVPEQAPDGREGVFAWSFYDSLDEDARKARLRRFNLGEKVRLEASPSLLKKIQATASIATWAGDIGIVVLKPSTRILQFCNHYETTEERGHHCFVLQAQQKVDYCAVATCQMILCYYRYYYSQDTIAPSLGYHPGGCDADQSPGYESLTCNHLHATYDTAPTWQKAKDQIDALHPLKTGIPGHARACAGYYRSVYAFASPQLYIYDPSPWNADFKLGGAIKWENWDSVTHTNFVYTQLNLC